LHGGETPCLYCWPAQRAWVAPEKLVWAWSVSGENALPHASHCMAIHIQSIAMNNTRHNHFTHQGPTTAIHINHIMLLASSLSISILTHTKENHSHIHNKHICAPGSIPGPTSGPPKLRRGPIYSWLAASASKSLTCRPKKVHKVIAQIKLAEQRHRRSRS